MTAKHIVLWLLMFVVVLFFFWVVFTNVVDIPNGDDLFCLLLFTQKYQDSSSLSQRIGLLTEQWVEHRVFFSRFAALVSYWIHQRVNFVTIIFIGNLNLIGFTWIFWRLLKLIGLTSPLYLLPVVMGLFSPAAYEGNLWAGAATVYMPVVFLGFLSVYLLAKDSNAAFCGALVSAVIASFSFGNGMFIFLAGLIVLIYLKRYKKAGIWLIMACTTVALYFRGFNAFSATGAFDVWVHFRYPIYLIYNGLVFIGGIVGYVDNTNGPFQRDNVLPLLAGIILLLIIVAGLFTSLFRLFSQHNSRYRRAEIAWMGMVIFIGLTALAMTYSRTSGESMNTVSSRYRIYSLLFFVLAYIRCLMFFDHKRNVSLIAGSAGFLALIFSYFIHYEEMSAGKASLLGGAFNYSTNKDWIIYRHTSYYGPASIAICRQIENEPDPVYHFTNPFPELTHAALAAARVTDAQISQEENCYGKAGKCISLSSDEYPHTPNVNQGVYVVVYDDTHIYLFPGKPRKNGRSNMFTTARYFKPGFTALVDYQYSLPKSEYKLALFSPSETGDKLRRLEGQISY